MDIFTTIPWTLIAASVLMAAGAVLVWRGGRLEVASFRMPPRELTKVLELVRGFRLAVAGLALAGLGAGWLWHQPWLIVLALIIAAEEILESSLVIFGLTRGRHLRLRP